LEPIVGSVLIGFIIIEDIIPVDLPLALDPLVQALVEHWFLGHLHVNVMLGRQLILRILTFHLNILMVFLVMVIVVVIMAVFRASTSDCLVNQALLW
jgi:formate hydrogenlyase subunit 4